MSDPDYALANAARLVGEISALNRPDVRAHLRRKQAQNMAPSTIQGTAYALHELDRFANGRRLRDLAPADLESYLVWARAQPGRNGKPRAATTVHVAAALVEAFYRWANGGVTLPAVKAAIRHEKPKTAKARTIPDAEFAALVAAAGDTRGPRVASVRSQALLWTYWDSGFRLSETLALRVKSVRFTPDGGAQLCLPPQEEIPMHRLKTGPRDVPVIECAPILKTWIALHPARDDADAPLFCTINEPAGGELNDVDVRQIMKRVHERAATPHVHPRLFRHTRATRAANAGWNEPKMRIYFGWEEDSDMPSHYVNQAFLNLEAQVRTDAKVDAAGAMIREDPKKAMMEMFITGLQAAKAAGVL